MTSYTVNDLFERLQKELCPKAAPAAIKIIIEEIGGLRVNIPTHDELYRQARNKKIRSLFKGDNYKELSLRFGLSVKQIKRILGGAEK